MTATRDALVLEHLHLVQAVARQLHFDRARRPAAPVDRDDYLAAGREALVGAAASWQKDQGSPFVPYAWAAISWAMRVENRSMRWQRQARHRPDRSLVSIHASWDRWPDEPDATIADTLIDPVSLRDDADLTITVQTAVERLRLPLREVVRLCWLEDMPQAEAAGRIGITQSAVSLRLRAARHVLARALSGLPDALEVAPGEVAA